MVRQVYATCNICFSFCHYITAASFNHHISDTHNNSHAVFIYSIYYNHTYIQITAVCLNYYYDTESNEWTHLHPKTFSKVLIPIILISGSNFFSALETSQNSIIFITLKTIMRNFHNHKNNGKGNNTIIRTTLQNNYNNDTDFGQKYQTLLKNSNNNQKYHQQQKKFLLTL